MPSRTNTDRIEELNTSFHTFAATTKVNTDKLLEKQVEIIDRLRTLESERQMEREKRIALEHRCERLEADRVDPANIAVLTQRTTYLEKLLDESRTRRWQVWLAFLSAGMSAVVALTVAFAKR